MIPSPYSRRFRSGLVNALTVAPLLLALPQASFAQRRGGQANPFAPPAATVHNAPERDYDLQNVAITLTIDYPNRTFTGQVVNTIAPLRLGSLVDLRFHCGVGLTVDSCLVGGQSAPFHRDGDMLIVTAPHPLDKSRPTEVTIRYAGGKKQGAGFGATAGGGGLHWIQPAPDNPFHVGFWTQGETSGNRDWAPTWDYPNDFTASETTVTVPEDWTVISNGVKTLDKVNPGAKTRTVHWTMTQPHATYLISLVAGPLDVKESHWEDVPLLYVVPKGKGNLIDDSFGDTPDMLSFFSKMTGVKYAWPKYAQDAVYDFGGGMENVSATTLGEGALTDRRAGFHDMASLNSHELAHQWFGDLVTCADWGQVWLNESFATFWEMLYLEHSRGKNVYDREVDGNTRAYLSEARRYKRPLATNLYSNPDAMFDSHTYPKGGVILHMLRRRLGDRAFFAGINRYLTLHRGTPVTSQDLEEAMTQASGVNTQPFFDEWVYKPGHPVLDYSWRYDDTAKTVALTVRQTQDTADGTPIYNLPLTIGVIDAGGKVTRVSVAANAAETTTVIPVTGRPDAVLIDPDHSLLRDIPKLPWTPAELPAILRFAPSGVDRTEALRRMFSIDPKTSAVAPPPPDEWIAVAADVARRDNDPFPALSTIRPLVALKRESLRPLFRLLLAHPNFDRRTEAVEGLAALGKTDEDTRTLRGLVNDSSPYSVIAAAVTTLAAWDAKGNLDILTRATTMSSRHEEIRQAAFAGLATGAPEQGIPLILAAAAPTATLQVRAAAISAMGMVNADEPKTREALRTALHDPSPTIAMAAVAAVGRRKDTALLPDLQELQKSPPPNAPGFFRFALTRAIDALQNPTGNQP